MDNEDTYFTSIGVRGSSIQVPTELLRKVGNGTAGPVTVGSVYYRNMSGLLPGTLPGTLPGERDTVLASPVVSTSLQCGDNICDTANIQFNQPVIVTLKHSKYAQVRHGSRSYLNTKSYCRLLLKMMIPARLLVCFGNL